LIVVSAIVVAALVFLFPPWRARAIRTTVRYGGVSGLAPSTVVDTIIWPLSFAPLYAPPRARLTGAQMQALAVRSMAGDTSARSALRRSTNDFERRYHVPEVLRTDGEIWRDSVLATAGISAIGSYDLAFTLDQRWLAARLAALALIAFMLDFRIGRGAAVRARDRHH